MKLVESHKHPCANLTTLTRVSSADEWNKQSVALKYWIKFQTMHAYTTLLGDSHVSIYAIHKLST